MADDNLTLFGLETEPMARESATLPIRLEQIDRIRQAFEGAGMDTQDERKALVDAVAIRDVPSLRDLTAVEGRRVLNRIKERKAAIPIQGGSSWDTREEDTWIDKL